MTEGAYIAPSVIYRVTIISKVYVVYIAPSVIYRVTIISKVYVVYIAPSVKLHRL
jgi:hypothetical protein